MATSFALRQVRQTSLNIAVVITAMKFAVLLARGNRFNPLKFQVTVFSCLRKSYTAGGR